MAYGAWIGRAMWSRLSRMYIPRSRHTAGRWCGLPPGFFFLPHGMQKLFGFWGGDIAKTAEGFAKQGLNPSLFWAYYIGSLEFFGGICLILGLLTRPVAALFVGFMFVAAFHVHIRYRLVLEAAAWRCRSTCC